MLSFFKNLQMLKAIEYGDVKAVRALLEKGVDPNFSRGQYDSKENLISIALSSRHLEIAQVLLEAGADLDVTYKWYNTSLLGMMAGAGYADGVQFVLKNNPDILNYRDQRGFSALHVAAGRGNTDCVKILLAHGADMNLRDADNRSPRYHAEKSNRTDILELFEQEEQKNLMKKEPVTAWKKLDDYKVVCITQEKKAGYTITDIFNFRARERTKICQNIVTRQESSQTILFDDMRDKNTLVEALGELTARNGKATPADITGILKPTPLSGKKDIRKRSSK